MPNGVYIMQGNSVILPCDIPYIYFIFLVSIIPSSGLNTVTNTIFMPPTWCWDKPDLHLLGSWKLWLRTHCIKATTFSKCSTSHHSHLQSTSLILSLSPPDLLWIPCNMALLIAWSRRMKDKWRKWSRNSITSIKVGCWMISRRCCWIGIRHWRDGTKISWRLEGTSWTLHHRTVARHGLGIKQLFGNFSAISCALVGGGSRLARLSSEDELSRSRGGDVRPKLDMRLRLRCKVKKVKQSGWIIFKFII